MAIVWGYAVYVCARGVPHATGVVDTSTRVCSFSSARLVQNSLFYGSRHLSRSFRTVPICQLLIVTPP